MKSSVFVTFDSISLSAGTKVFYHEIQALKKCTDLKCVVARGYPNNDVPFKKLDFENWYQFNPFLADYFASQLVKEFEGIDFVHLACSPGNAILSILKPKHYTTHIIAHDLKESILEHIKYYGSYNLVHNTNPYLHDLLLAHAEKADVIVTASEVARKWILENTKAKKVVAIPHGTEISSETKIAPWPDKFTVGYMGAFGPDKGLPYLILAWKFFKEVNSELIFAGNCCQILQQDNIKKLFLDGVDKVSYLGWVNNVSDFYNNISIYIQPSTTEGFGIEVPEAMAYARPVIVTSTTGAADLVTDGIDGFIVPPRDPKAILDKISWFYNNPDKIKEMGLAAREKAKKYTWQWVEDQYVQMWSKIIDEGI